MSRKATYAFYISKLLQEPFVALYPMMAVLLTKEMGATPFQVAVLTMLKPTVSILSFYWSSSLLWRHHLLKANLVLATGLAVLPFLFAAWIDHVWLFIAAGASYSLFWRAGIPALMELLRINTKDHEEIFSRASSFSYAIGVLAAMTYGFLLDLHPTWWKALFAVSAVTSLTSVIFLLRFESPKPKKISSDPSITTFLTHPWKAALQLLQAKPAFFRFQLGFFIAGFGLMLAMPAIPGFLGALDLSYTKLFLSLSVLQGLGFILSSPLWTSWLKRVPIHSLSISVFLSFSLFLVALLLCIFHPSWIFLAYLIYGIAQAESHLVWNLSGTLFAQEESSAQYSSVSVLTIGLRGLIAPPLGGLLAQYGSPEICLTVGSLMCVAGGYYMAVTREPGRAVS